MDKCTAKAAEILVNLAKTYCDGAFPREALKRHKDEALEKVGACKDVRKRPAATASCHDNADSGTSKPIERDPDKKVKADSAPKAKAKPKATKNDVEKRMSQAGCALQNISLWEEGVEHDLVYSVIQTIDLPIGWLAAWCNIAPLVQTLAEFWLLKHEHVRANSVRHRLTPVGHQHVTNTNQCNYTNRSPTNLIASAEQPNEYIKIVVGLLFVSV